MRRLTQRFLQGWGSSPRRAWGKRPPCRGAGTRMTIPALATLLLACGCSSTPSAHFYTFDTLSAPAVPASKIAVAVGPVSVPAEVDRPQIVVSTGPNQVRLDEFNRWAAPLQSAITNAVAQNLVTLLGTPNVTLASQTLSADTDYRVAIEVQAFASAPGDAATLDAVWTVRRMRDGAATTGRTAVREPAKEQGFDALAAAHSRAIASMSRNIADALRALDNAPPGQSAVNSVK